MVKLVVRFWLSCLLLAIFGHCQDYRLPETVSPSRYEVNLVVPATVFTGATDVFEGTSTMTFTVTEATNEIKLHHRVDDSSLVVTISDGITILSQVYGDNEIYTITTQETLSVGTTYQLFFSYSSTFESSVMRGFYLSTYKDENNETAYLVTTQFESISARHAFPCLDEPQYKATFAVSLTYPTGLNALANTDIENSTETTIDNVAYTISYYRETTIMSTYLNAFIISKFTCSEGDTIATNVPHRVCSRDESAEDRTFAVEVGPPIIRSLESITGIKYGEYMPKMDQVAIPDFSAGAMENWGLVTYRETGILFSEENTSNSYKKSIALVIAHEFTHMWFGNLVTCKWWEYTFLNEGFARFYQYFATAVTHQFFDWELDKHFNVEQLHTALLADSVETAQALTSTANSDSEVSNKFSTISYNKGASILRMIETNILGTNNFVYGIRDYLSENQLTGTVPSQLWESLSKFVPSNSLPAETDLPTVLNNWVEESGHPVVKVSKSGTDVVLTQVRFLLVSGNTSLEYYVPITYTTSSDITKFSNTTVKNWLVPGSSLTLSGVLTDSDWIILNNRQSGFYRVDYDEELWTGIINQLNTNHLEIDVLNRAQIVSDTYNFARASHRDGYGDWNYTQTFNILKYLENEVDYYPWYAAIIGNNDLLLRIGYDSDEGLQFIEWMLKLMANVYSTVPFDTLDSSNQVYTMKQVLILTRVCKYAEANCVSRAKEIFAEYRNNGVNVPKNLRTFVYCTALRFSDDIEGDFSFLYGKYLETKLASEIITLYYGFGCIEDSSVLKWYLKQSINETAGVRTQDFSTYWSYVYTSGKPGVNAALEYIAEDYAALTASYSSVGSLISTISGYIYDSTQIEKLEALRDLEGISDSHKSTIESAITTAEAAITRAEALKQDVASFISTLSSSGQRQIESFASILVLNVLLFILHKIFM